MKGELISAAEAARILGVAEPILKRWETGGQGPPFYRLADGHVRYVRHEVEAYKRKSGQGPQNRRMKEQTESRPARQENTESRPAEWTKK